MPISSFDAATEIDHSDEEPEKTKLYKRRWIFLFALTVLKMLASFLTHGFAQVGNIYTILYAVTYKQVDWVTLACSFMVVVWTPIIAWFNFKGFLQLRRFSVLSSFAVVIALTMIMLAFSNSRLFSLLVIGQLFTGVTVVTCFAIRASFAVLWFPEDEVGISMGINFLGSAVARILAFTIPTNVLMSPKTYMTQINCTLFASITACTGLEEWKEYNLEKLNKIFSPLLFIALCVAVFLFLYISDLPPLPPTKAQALKWDNQMLEDQATFRNFLCSSFKLFTDKVYVSCALMYSLLEIIPLSEFILMDQIFSDMLAKQRNSSMDEQVISGYLMVCYCIAGAVGSLVGGRIADKAPHKLRNMLLIFGTFLTFLSVLGVLLSVLYSSVAGLFVSCGLFGFCSYVETITLLVIITDHIYPTDESFAVTWLIGCVAAISLLGSEISRLIFTLTSPSGALIFHCCIVLFIVLISLPFKSSSRRNSFVSIQDDESVVLLPKQRKP